MDIIPRSNVVHKLQKRGLLIAINCVAGLSIFFFGYDQGMMGGVNNAPNYYYETMKFGHPDPVTGAPVITNTLLQGGIVSYPRIGVKPWMLLLMWIGVYLLPRYPHGLSRWWLVR